MSTKTSSSIGPSRRLVVARFIEQLHDLKNLFPKSPDQFLELSDNWENLIEKIPTQFLRKRGANSFFNQCALAELTEAVDVWNLWVSTTGGAIHVENRRREIHEELTDLAKEPEAVGPARRRMQDWLVHHGVAL